MTKNNHLVKSHNAENCNRGNPLGFLKIQFVAIYQKIEEGTIWRQKKFEKMSHSAETIEKGALWSRPVLLVTLKK